MLETTHIQQSQLKTDGPHRIQKILEALVSNMPPENTGSSKNVFGNIKLEFHYSKCNKSFLVFIEDQNIWVHPTTLPPPILCLEPDVVGLHQPDMSSGCPSSRLYFDPFIHSRPQ